MLFDDLPYKVIDNFLPEWKWRMINDLLSGPYFPWHYQSNLTHMDKPSEVGNFGFNHWVVRIDEDVSDYTPPQDNRWEVRDVILPVCLSVQEVIGTDYLISKTRCDLTVYNPSFHIHEPHVDFPDRKHIAAVYYVNNSDGNTVLYDQQVDFNGSSFDKNSLTKMVEIEPVANRILIFDGSYIHTGHSPSKHNNRILINSDYVQKIIQ